VVLLFSHVFVLVSKSVLLDDVNENRKIVRYQGMHCHPVPTQSAKRLRVESKESLEHIYCVMMQDQVN
jgi:hypothetical protein